MSSLDNQKIARISIPMARRMNTFHLVLRVIPAPENPYVNEVEGYTSVRDLLP